MTVEKRINEIVAFLLGSLKDDSVQVNKIVLFGSHVNDTATEESDLDIAIISEDFHNKNIFERGKLVSNSERNTIKRYMIPLDIVMLTPEELTKEDTLLSSYIQNGKVLFAA